MSLWLIGAGVMSQDYAKVLQDLNVGFRVVGRSQGTAASFEKATGKSVNIGLAELLEKEAPPADAIVAVSIEQLVATTETLIRAGTKRILVEKPAGLNLREIENLNKIAIDFDAKVLIGYNRRFYSSVEKVREIITEDGGLQSCIFEFTEWAHEIITLSKAKGVKEHWVLGNSSHVIDLVFHLIGKPADWNFWHSGTIDWHPSSSKFVGAGISDRNILFSYHANWQAPGRWGIELLTNRNRLILRPMEHLKLTKLGSLREDVVNIDNSIDLDYKPGLYKQTKKFLNQDYKLFCSLSQQVENVETYSRMAGYES